MTSKELLASLPSTQQARASLFCSGNLYAEGFIHWVRAEQHGIFICAAARPQEEPKGVVTLKLEEADDTMTLTDCYLCKASGAMHDFHWKPEEL